jgi:hypothetical protein
MKQILTVGHFERDRCRLPDPEYVDERQGCHSTPFQKLPRTSSQGLHHQERLQVINQLS